MPLRHRLNKECSREKFLKWGATDELGTLAGVSHKTCEHAAANVPEPVIDATRKKKLSINAAYDITRMDTEKQQEIAERISNGETPSNARVTYEQEKQLGEDPVRLDFLIIKKNNNDVTLNDPIGKFFRAVNIFEYKSPEDGLSIDDFYKAQGYGLIYKGYDRKVNELPIEEMTLTLVRHSYPRELMRTLKKTGFIIRKPYKGIYRIEGKISIPVQIVISSRLPDGECEGLKLLAKGCTKEAVIHYAEKAIASGDENVKTNAGTVIGICLDINEELGAQLKEDGTMNETINVCRVREISADDKNVA